MLAAAALASAASAEDQWAPTGAAAVSAPGPTAASEYTHHYPPSAPAAPAPALSRQSSDPAGILSGASMFRSMRESLADFSGRVGRGFSSAIGLNQEQFQSGDSSTRVRYCNT